jgi:hypothetical protein
MHSIELEIRGGDLNTNAGFLFHSQGNVNRFLEVIPFWFK